MRTIKVGMYPYPPKNSQWDTSCHPLLPEISGNLSKLGIQVIGLSVQDILNPELLIQKNCDILHFHWTEGITDSFIFQTNPLFRKLQLKFRIIPDFVFHLIFFFQKIKLDQWSKALIDTKIPFVYEIHELDTHNVDVPLNYRLLDAKIKNFFIQNSNGHIIHEESNLQYIKSRYQIDKLYAVGYLGNYQKFHGNIISTEEAREILKLDKNKTIFAYIGTVRVNRNPKNVIQTFLEIGRQDTILILAGQGMEQYVIMDERIIVYGGTIPNELLRNIFCSADFIINDAEQYFTSAAIRAAIGYYKPIIAWEYGASIDMAKGAGIFLSDDLSIKDAMLRALEMDPEEYQSMVDAAKMNDEERSWRTGAENIFELYKKILSSISMTDTNSKSRKKNKFVFARKF